MWNMFIQFLSLNISPVICCLQVLLGNVYTASPLYLFWIKKPRRKALYNNHYKLLRAFWNQTLSHVSTHMVFWPRRNKRERYFLIRIVRWSNAYLKSHFSPQPSNTHLVISSLCGQFFVPIAPPSSINTSIIGLTIAVMSWH